MKAQKKANLLNNEITQPSKYRTKNLFEINDNLRGIYNTNGQCKDYNVEVKSLWFQWCMHSCEGNDKDYRVTKISIIYGYERDGYEKTIVLSLISIENSKILKYHTFSIKH